MKTVLVTAAGGNAGRNIVEALLAKGLKVVATSRNPEQLSVPAGVERRTYDAHGKTNYESLLAGIDDVVLIAPPLDGSVHEILHPLITAASQSDIKHLVFMSGNYLAGFSGKSLDNLPVRKVELQIIASGLQYTFVRAGFFMDNFLTGFNAPMVERGNITLAVGAAKSAFVAAADVGVFVAEALVQNLYGEYLVTGPDALDHFEVAQLLSEKLNRHIKYTPITEEELVAAYTARGLPLDTINYGLTLYKAFRNYATAAVTDSFFQVTGRQPLSFKAFLL